MAVRAWILLGLLSGCGRLGFDTREGIDAPPATELVGELDPGFATAGVLLYNYVDDDGESKDDVATGVAIDGQGRIVASASGQFQFYVSGDQVDMAAITLRLAANGQLDPGYQSGARSTPGVTTDSSGVFSHGEDVWVDPAGDVTLCGYREWSGTDDPTLYRYGAVGGQLDPRFGAGGLVQITMPGEVRCRGIAHDDTDDTFVITGEGEGAMIVAKVRRDTGALVTELAGTGRLVYDSGGDDVGEDVVIDAGRRIYIVGTTTPTTADLTVWRYLPDGTLDGGFGIGGVVRFDTGGEDRGYGAALAPDGGLIVVGSSAGPGEAPRPVVLRLTEAGLDPNFGNAGSILLPTDGAAHDVVVDGAGTISVTGTATITTAVVGGNGMAVWRLRGDGTPDPGFGLEGAFVTTAGADGGDHAGLALAIDPSGALVVAGRSFSATAGFFDAAIWRVR